MQAEREGRVATIAIVQRVFPHYRRTMFEELLAREQMRYILVGDVCAESDGIKCWDPSPHCEVVNAAMTSIGLGLYFQRGVMRIALRRDIECIVYEGNGRYVTTWASAIVARMLGKRVIFWTHGWRSRKNGVGGWIKTLFYGIAHRLLLYGDGAKSIGISLGFAAVNLCVIYNGLDYRYQARLREQRERKTITLAAVREETSKYPMVVCVARLTPECRLELLLRAQKLLIERKHLVSVLLVGDGPARKELETLSQQLNVPVKFYGACHDEESICEIMSQVAVTVSPGKVGLTAMQSLAYGVPVITHGNAERQMPEWEAIIPGVTGDLFAEGDVGDLACKVEKWTRTLCPREEVRRACMAMIEGRYNAVSQASRMHAAIRGVIDGK